MSDIEKVYGAIADLKERLADTDGGFLMDVKVSRESLRTLVEYTEERLAGVRVRPFKVGDKVQEICDEIGDEKPVGTVTERGSLGQHVVLENTRYKGRKLYYYDNEIEPFGTTPEPTFTVGQKVETLKEIQVQGMVVKAGTIGTVMEVNSLAMHEIHVLFSDAMGTHSFWFDADELKEV